MYKPGYPGIITCRSYFDINTNYIKLTVRNCFANSIIVYKSQCAILYWERTLIIYYNIINYYTWISGIYDSKKIYGHLITIKK